MCKPKKRPRKIPLLVILAPVLQVAEKRPEISPGTQLRRLFPDEQGENRTSIQGVCGIELQIVTKKDWPEIKTLAIDTLLLGSAEKWPNLQARFVFATDPGKNRPKKIGDRRPPSPGLAISREEGKADFVPPEEVVNLATQREKCKIIPPVLGAAVEKKWKKRELVAAPIFSRAEIVVEQVQPLKIREFRLPLSGGQRIKIFAVADPHRRVGSMEIQGPQPEFPLLALSFVFQKRAEGIYTDIVKLFVLTIVDKGPERKYSPLSGPNPERRKKQQQCHLHEKNFTFHRQQRQQAKKINFINNARY
ncbi:MAG TPA: hypothetical protein VD811_08460 [Desulfuromonadales bacterium]|nr:hypothetical protein [Desulfuromonadales bacterium]